MGCLHFAATANANGAQIKPESAYFALGVAQKNLGKIDEAIVSMSGALRLNPSSTATKIALAGYFGIAGKKAESAAMFNSVAVPPPGTMAHMDYLINAAWFNATLRDAKGVMKYAKAAIASRNQLHYPATKSYFATETDFDFVRSSPAFKALLK